jgi:hypothetical protein
MNAEPWEPVGPLLCNCKATTCKRNFQQIRRNKTFEYALLDMAFWITEPIMRSFYWYDSFSR